MPPICKLIPYSISANRNQSLDGKVMAVRDMMNKLILYVGNH